MSNEPTKKILVPLAKGFEEIEAVTIIDVLRRADVEVTIAGTEDDPIEGSRGIYIEPDELLEDIFGASLFDGIVIPGGADGVKNLNKDTHFVELLNSFMDEGKLVAAICAAPALLVAQGLLGGQNATSHPSVENLVAQTTEYSEERVVIDGNLITSRGPGTAMEFALVLVEELVDAAKANELKSAMLA